MSTSNIDTTESSTLPISEAEQTWLRHVGVSSAEVWPVHACTGDDPDSLSLRELQREHGIRVPKRALRLGDGRSVVCYTHADLGTGLPKLRIFPNISALYDAHPFIGWGGPIHPWSDK